MPLTTASLFSGGGGEDIGAMAAGFTPVCALEYDKDIAEVYRQNLGDHIRVGDILDENPATWPDVDHLHASPPCPNFSTAKANAAETPHDIALAVKVAEFITVKRPKWFTLENVRAYKKSASFAIICKALSDCGYMYDAPILNAADFGVPQTRIRLFLRATRTGLLRPLPEPKCWIGWYDAIADLIPTLPESKFADWQLARLPADIFDAGFIANTNQSERDDVVREQAQPSYTVTSKGSVGRTRAWLVESKNANQQYGDGVRQQEEPATTVITDHKFSHRPTAFIIDQLNGSRDSTVRSGDEPVFTTSIYSVKHPAPRAWLSQGRVVKMTPRALARFQSFPDWYTLPDKAALACRIIGNAVPPLVAEAVLEGMK